jgi:hypothetical protein
MFITMGNHRSYQWSAIGMLLLIIFSVWGPAITNAQRTAPASEGFIVNKVENLVGIWEEMFKGSVAYRQFDADGTFKCAVGKIKRLRDSSSLVYTGRFWFEGDVLKISETLTSLAGTYKVRAKKGDGKSVHLSFENMGDPDSLRAANWSKGMTQVER